MVSAFISTFGVAAAAGRLAVRATAVSAVIGSAG
jgi:hypothetical protein